MKHVGMSQRAPPNTGNDVTRHLKPPKVTTFAALPSSRAVADCCGRLPSLANTCSRESDVERTRPNPQTPEVKREPFATHSGKYDVVSIFASVDSIVDCI